MIDKVGQVVAGMQDDPAYVVLHSVNTMVKRGYGKDFIEGVLRGLGEHISVVNAYSPKVASNLVDVIISYAKEGDDPRRVGKALRFFGKQEVRELVEGAPDPFYVSAFLLRVLETGGEDLALETAKTLNQLRPYGDMEIFVSHLKSALDKGVDELKFALKQYRKK